MSKISRRSFLGQSGLAALASLFSNKSFSQADPKGEIVRAVIHPSMGVARVGNSLEYYYGPEVTEPTPLQPGEIRSENGALKRQAARFRIYGYNALGEVVREITLDDAEIDWQVHMANKKAEWYRFIAAMDIPEAKDMKVQRRNLNVKGRTRKDLVIDPGPKNISGRQKSGSAFQLDGGFFQRTPVSLGELRTDEKGRLVVLGGLGKATSPLKKPIFNPQDNDTFNNADGWYDDIGDGPVRARVKINGVDIPVDPAWVFVGPPNYAPDIIGWRTLYDLLQNSYVMSGLLPVPRTTSFTKDVLPLLRRLSNLQWVNKGFADHYGVGSKMNFDDPALIAKLADKSEAKLRQKIYKSFRLADTDQKNPRLWPMIYGDAYGSFPDSHRNNLSVHDLGDLHLKRWANREELSDWSPNLKPSPKNLDEVPLQDQPAMLDKASLHFCLADAFHPGCELTWPMRHTTMYSAPFRIKHKPSGEPDPDYGDFLTQEQVLKLNGPLYAQGPGDLTKWMAVPWHGDTIFCRSGYEPEFDPYLPTYWPARVPNHVLTEADYQIVMNTTLSLEQRLNAFNNRANWVRMMKGNAPRQMLQMVDQFGQMGIVEARPGPVNDPNFPPTLFVESTPLNVPLIPASAPKSVNEVTSTTRNVPKASLDPVKKAGWEDRQQLEEFLRIMKRK